MEERNPLICAVCGCEIEEDDNYSCVGEDVVCETCTDEECGYCDRCGELIYNENAVYDDNHFLCPTCFHEHYTRCTRCDTIIHEDDSKNDIMRRQSSK